MTSRIHRGFHRIGAVLAVPVALVASWIACAETWQAWSTSGLPREEFAGSDGSISFEEAFGTHHAYYGYALAWIFFAVALYVIARAVGWILAGFLSPEH